MRHQYFEMNGFSGTGFPMLLLIAVVVVIAVIIFFAV